MLARRWAIPILIFAAITAWWLFPILSNLSSVIPGVGAGDNVTFVWNVWWMRYVLHHPGHTFFFTPLLFHPIGVDLTLHTHTALPALIGAISSSPIAGQNVVIALHIYLNFLFAYALAHRITRRMMPSLIAALVFGTSSFVSAHLNGHFNLIAAWTLPLVALLTLNALERTSWLRGIAVGVALAATAYTDYYLFVYAMVMLGILWISPALRLTQKPQTGIPASSQLRRRLLRAGMALLLLDAFVIAGILLMPTDRIDIGSIHISVRSLRNPITAGWILLVVTAVIASSARVGIDTARDSVRRGRNVPIAAIATTAVLLMPLLTHAGFIWRAGNYVSQTYLWRSGPAGIDAATLVLGNPFHALWGDSIRPLYDRLHIDVIESGGWVPLCALPLAIAAIAFRRGGPTTAPWVLTGMLFIVWALGPWLTVFGRQTPLMLPGMFLRYVPVVSNARIPGRAMVMVYLAIAMLAAIGVDRLISRGRSVRLVALGLVLIVIIECIPSRPPLYAPDIPSKYFALRTAPRAGAICELPFGLRDGFGEIGSLDEAILLHQTVHERPILGGFVARLPPSIVRSYETMPVVRSLLRLSAGRNALQEDLALTRAETGRALASADIAFVVLDTRTASSDLIEYVQSKIELRQIAEEDGRVFYEVK